MRRLAFALAVAAALTAGSAGAQARPSATTVKVISPQAAPPALPDPRTLTLTWLYWGRMTSEWTVPRGGEARWANEAGESKTFMVTEADFDRLRDIFRPYEGRAFECERVLTDGAYGRLTWSQPGREDQQLKWDTGCVTGDADDVFDRVDQAVTLLKGLSDR
jgi:hypothetical protein